MRSSDFPHVRPFGMPRAADFNALLDLAEQITRFTAADGATLLSEGAFSYAPREPRFLFGQVTGNDGGSPRKYSWRECLLYDDGTIVPKDDGIEGTLTELYAYEFNQSDVANSTYGIFWQSDANEEVYWFAHCCGAFNEPVAITSPTGPALTAMVSDSGTTNVPTVSTIAHTTSGTPAAGFGAKEAVTLDTTTTENVEAAGFVVTWVDPTGASPNAQYQITTAGPGGLVTGYQQQTDNNNHTIISIGNGSTPTASTVLQINAPAATYTPIVIQGATSQSANLLTVKDQGGTTKISIDSNFKFLTTASTTTAAGLNLPHGTAPSSPVNGDIWTTTAGVFAQVNGATVDLSTSTPGNEFPRWVKVTKTYSDLAIAAVTNTITLYTLPAKGVIHAVVIKTTTAFAGGSISSYYLEVGPTGNTSRYIPGATYDGFTAVSETHLYNSGSGGGGTTSVLPECINFGGWSVSLRADANVNLDNATQGSVDVYLLVSTPP